MKTKNVILVFYVIIFCALNIFTQSVVFVKTIYFNEKVKDKRIVSFLLGKKQKSEINPGSLSRIGKNLLCITDSINGAVIIVDDDGNILKKITQVKGLKIVSPVSSCRDDGGNLYISDSALRVVLQFDNNYKFKEIFIAQAQSRITGIIFKKGIFYCVDTLNHRILCFDREGVLKNSFGKRGSAPGEFNFPTHIVTDNQYLYITDAMNFRVQIFDHSGKFVKTFGSLGRRGGNFSKPKGLAVDQEKRIYVADAMFDNVQIFNFKGEFLYYFGYPGQKEGEFWMPSGIMVDNDNLIWVSDTYNHRLQVFRLTFTEETP